MTTYAPPTRREARAAEQRRTRRQARPLPHALRLILGLAFIASGVAIVVFEGAVRAVEAHILAWLLGTGFLAEQAFPSTSGGSPAVLFAHDGDWLAVRITAQCAIAFYLAAVLGLAALLSLVRRVRIGRLLTATALAIAGLTALNQLRLLVIAVAFSRGGHDAFAWAHGPIGTVMMLVGIAGALTLFFFLCVRRAPERRRTTRPDRNGATR
jgi:exosortase/archaeosortase family protein